LETVLHNGLDREVYNLRPANYTTTTTTTKKLVQRVTLIANLTIDFDVETEKGNS